MKIKEKMHINKKLNLVVSPAYLACGAVVIYLISLLPILTLSFYCHPSADDFNYGVKTHLAVMSGQGICGIIRAALERYARIIPVGRAHFRQFSFFHFNRESFPNLLIF